MSLLEPEIQSRTIGTKLREVRELAAHPAWIHQLEPFLAQLEKEHTESAISPGLTPQARSEHVQAIQSIRKIRSFPRDRENELEASWRLQQKKRPSA